MDIRLFLSSWLRSPKHVGAFAPSSDTLAAALAACVTKPAHDFVLELGAGTGVVTRALLDRGVPPEHLCVIERDRQFCTRLRQRFPEVLIIQGDARRLRRLLLAHGISQVDCVISGLPLLSLGPTTQLTVIHEALSVLAPAGYFNQFTYGLTVPVHPQVRERLHIEPERIGSVWRNLPPAALWRFRSTLSNPETSLAA